MTIFETDPFRTEQGPTPMQTVPVWLWAGAASIDDWNLLQQEIGDAETEEQETSHGTFRSRRVFCRSLGLIAMYDTGMDVSPDWMHVLRYESDEAFSVGRSLYYIGGVGHEDADQLPPPEPSVDQ